MEPESVEPKLASLLAAAGQLNEWAGRFSSWAVCDERGTLTTQDRVEEAKLTARSSALQAAAEQAFAAMPAADVKHHDDAVAAAVALLQAGGGKHENVYIDTYGPRAADTASPKRRFDGWAIWITYVLLPGKKPE